MFKHRKSWCIPSLATLYLSNPMYTFLEHGRMLQLLAFSEQCMGVLEPTDNNDEEQDGIEFGIYQNEE